MSVKLQARQKIERLLVDRTVDALLKAGFELSVTNGGDEPEIDRSIDAAAIKVSLMLCDEETLIAHRPNVDADEESYGWVRFVYGNDGWDVISDYSTDLEEALADVNALAEKIDEGHFDVTVPCSVCGGVNVGHTCCPPRELGEQPVGPASHPAFKKEA